MSTSVRLCSDVDSAAAAAQVNQHLKVHYSINRQGSRTRQLNLVSCRQRASPEKC